MCQLGTRFFNKSFSFCFVLFLFCFFFLLLLFFFLNRYTKKTAGCPDPVLSKLQADRHFGAVSEKFSDSVMNYTEVNPDKCLTSEEFEEKYVLERVDVK